MKQSSRRCTAYASRVTQTSTKSTNDSTGSRPSSRALGFRHQKKQKDRSVAGRPGLPRPSPRIHFQTTTAWPGVTPG